MSSNISSAECLTFGFVRENIQDIDDWDIIPFDVIGLCHAYYTVPINIFLFCGNQFGKDISLNGMVCVNMNEKKRIQFKIYNAQTVENDDDNDGTQENDVNDDNDEEILYWDSSDEEEEDEDGSNKINTENIIKDATLNSDWNTIKSGYCYTSNIVLPQFILNKYIELKELMDYSLCGIFKCGGRISSTFNRITNVSLIIFKSNDINWTKKRNKICNDDIINAYHISLPSTPIPATVECIYSNYYGLFNIYDGSPNIYRLPFGDIFNDFNGNNKDKWNWMKMESMNYTHYKGSLCLINGDNERLFICGGYSYDGNKCEILDIYNNKWQILPNLLYKVSQNGIKYDFCKNRIYIGGGSRTYSKQKNASNLCSYYDIFKNKWYKLANTNYEHCHHPLLFINDRAPNLLYIAGNDQHDIGFSEYLDLREKNKKKKWKKVNDEYQLSKYFNINKNALIKRLCV